MNANEGLLNCISAAYIDDSERVAFLLVRGADRKLKNKSGEEAVRFAGVQQS